MSSEVAKPRHENPAELLESIDSLLQDINNGIQQLIPSGQAEDYAIASDKQLDAAGGSFRLEPPGELGWILIPNIPRAMTVYGAEKSRFLGSFVAGQTIRLQVPKVQVIYIEYPAAAATSSVTVWYASRPLSVTDAVSGAALLVGQQTMAASAPVVIASDQSRIAAYVTAGGVGSDALSSTTAFFVDSVGAARTASVAPLVFNGASWDRPRTPNVFKSTSFQAAGDTAIWTPAAGKKFRLMKYKIDVTAEAATAAGANELFSWKDSATALALFERVWIPAASVATGPVGSGWTTGWIDLGNGALSSTINNVLNLNLPTALTAGFVVAHAIGTEE